MDTRHAAHWAGLVGGLLWVFKLFAGGLDTALTWVGAVLITAGLVQLGLMLVKSDFMALRVFVGLAVPAVVWSVVLAARPGVPNGDVLDAAFGAVVALSALAQLFGSGAGSHRATL